MPNTYAHYRFGLDVYREMTPQEQALVRRHNRLYFLGLHGPDLLFYYRPLFTNKINSIGYDMHEWTGRQFFTRGAHLVRVSPDPPAAQAYLMGFVCHFALDSICHPYVDEKIRQSGAEHTEIEGAFDRALMVHDGLDPVRHRTMDHIIPDRRGAAVIAPFFAPATRENIYLAMRSMALCGNLMTAPGSFQRYLIDKVLHLTGNWESMHGMIITKHRDRQFADSDRRLWQLYHQALSEVPSMLRQTEDLIRGTGSPDARFNRTFSGKITGNI
ncbi:MAG: zinc dependent phospholipase C family protein [Lachnospiraceae bacterium]|jgi:hypothetical protein